MLRKVGINRPNKLNLESKKVAPPQVPGGETYSPKASEIYPQNGAHAVVYSNSGAQGRVRSDIINYSDENHGIKKVSEGFSQAEDIISQHFDNSGKMKDPYCFGYKSNLITPSSLGSPCSVQDISPSKMSNRNSVSSIDSGWRSNTVDQKGSGGELSSFSCQTSSMSLNSDKNSSIGVNDKVISSSSSDCGQETQQLKRYSRGSLVSTESAGQQSSKSSVYSSSSSLGSSRVGEEIISTLDINEMIIKGLPDEEIVTCWLADFRFDEYTSFFLAAGYDMPTISKMTPEDLTAVGIKKPHHRKKIKSEITNLSIPDGLPVSLPPSVEAMMTWLRIPEYILVLQEQGYTTVKGLLSISIEDLEDIGFYRLGHQKKLLLGIKRVKNIIAGEKFDNEQICKQKVNYYSQNTEPNSPVSNKGRHSFSSFHQSPASAELKNQIRFPSHDQELPCTRGHQSYQISTTPNLPYPSQIVNRNIQQHTFHSSTFPTSYQPKSMPTEILHHQDVADPLLDYHSDKMPPPMNLIPQPLSPRNSQLYPNENLPLMENESHHESVWQKFPNHFKSAAQIHSQPGSRNGTLKRISTTGSLPRPTATVKPLSNMEFNSGIGQGDIKEEKYDFPPPPTNGRLSIDNINDSYINLPFANERSGTIKLKSSPLEFSEWQQKEPAKEKNYLKSPSRTGNRTAGDVMDDISSMLEVLTDELDSMLCHESVE